MLRNQKRAARPRPPPLRSLNDLLEIPDPGPLPEVQLQQLLLAHLGGARLVVPVGDPATLEELIDRDRGDQASTVLTRLRLGTTVVDASSVPLLYTGRVRLWHVLLVLLAAVAVLGVTVAATPIGNDWWHDWIHRLPERLGGDA